MSKIDLTKTFKFHHEDSPETIYTRTPDGIISWGELTTGYDITLEAGSTEEYTDYTVTSYFSTGTWVLVETTDED